LLALRVGQSGVDHRDRADRHGRKPARHGRGRRARRELGGGGEVLADVLKPSQNASPTLLFSFFASLVGVSSPGVVVLALAVSGSVLVEASATAVR